MIPPLRPRLAIALLLSLVCGSASQSWSAEQPGILAVGPGKPYDKPSDAARAASPGSRVQIFPGTYTDCAVWRQSDLVIEGVGEGVVIGNRACADKGVFVITGDNVTVRNITLTGAQVRDHNGAGIRAHGRNLTVEKVRFVDNEEGILATVPGGTLVVRDSYFKGNGNCIGACAHGIYANHPDRLRVERSEFFQQHTGHHIKSRAAVTEVVNNFIHDGPEGDSSYLIDIPNGGTVTITGNRLQKGPHSANPATAIAIGAEKGKPQHNSDGISITQNEFVNDTGRSVVFVRNLSATQARLSDNRLRGAVTPLDGP